MVLSPCIGTFISPGPEVNNEQFLRSSSYTSNQIHYLKVSVFPPRPLLRILCLYNVSSMDKFHRTKRFLISVAWLFYISELQGRHRAFLLSSIQQHGNNLLSKTECQQSASQLQTNQGLSSQRIPYQADRKDLRGTHSGGSGKRSYHIHTLQEEPVKQDTRETVLVKHGFVQKLLPSLEFAAYQMGIFLQSL